MYLDFFVKFLFVLLLGLNKPPFSKPVVVWNLLNLDVRSFIVAYVATELELNTPSFTEQLWN